MRDVQVYPTPTELFERSAAIFTDQARAAIRERGRFVALLSGGSAPLGLYDRFKNLDLPWEKIHLFWGDERMVPESSAQSNYGEFKRRFLGSLSIPSENVHPIRTEIGAPAEAAKAYEEELKLEFGHAPWPRFDLALQGIGADGHTASLFPGSNYEHDSPRWVIAPYVEKLGSFRISVTLGVLNAARVVLFLVLGEQKAEIVHQVLGEPTAHRALLPAQRVRPTAGRLFWMIDELAASRL